MNKNYLSLRQAAYLLDISKESMYSLSKYAIKSKKLDGKLYIENAEFKRYVIKKLEDYIFAVSYFKTKDKAAFWVKHNLREKHNRRFESLSQLPDTNEYSYLTVPQVCFLLHMKTGSVRNLLFRGKLKKVLPVNINKKTEVSFLIPSNEVRTFVNDKIKIYKKALEYLKTENKSAFWIKHSEDYEKWLNIHRERVRNYGK